ncbi:hypothetical protein Tco_0917718, partial [Tanacetum coccineum]
FYSVSIESFCLGQGFKSLRGHRGVLISVSSGKRTDKMLGVPAADAPKKISGVHKRCWKYIPNSYKTEQITSQPQPEPEAQAA